MDLRRKTALKRLQDSVNYPVINKYGKWKAFRIVANNLQVTSQTVENYVKGRCPDGFLIDAMTREFKKLSNQIIHEEKQTA